MQRFACCFSPKPNTHSTTTNRFSHPPPPRVLPPSRRSPSSIAASPPSKIEMAFVPSLPLPTLSTSPAAPFRSSKPPCTPARTRVPRASSSSSRPTESVAQVRRAKNPKELHLLYAVWNAVASDEGLPSLAPDELDAASSTVHLIARAPDRSVSGAARLLRTGQNARLDRVAVLPAWRGRGVGRALVERLLVLAAPVEGAIYVNATRGEMGFFSILGFETLGNDFVDGVVQMRTMVYRTPVCAPASGCVGLHHTSVRVSDIERSLAFYGSLGFAVTDKFVTAGGQRACYVEGLGTRLEFVEANDGHGGLSGVQGVPHTGFDRLVFDVTKACTDLETFLQHLERRNGGMMNVAAQPAKQVAGSHVVSVASVYDPDALPIDFIRREAQVPSELRTKVDW